MYILSKKLRVFWKSHLSFFYSVRAHFFRCNLLEFLRKYLQFTKEFKLFLRFGDNLNFKNILWYPCLFDNTDTTPIEPVYFFQDTWAAKKIFDLKPSHHFDIGSSAKTIGILSQFVPITMIDIRPLDLKLKGLNFKQGSILKLPFDDQTIDSLSSLCVIEHIGLGRYGDQIDTFGSEKAIVEIKRVMKVGGILLISLPVDRENKVFFNAHRTFTRNYIVSMFSEFDILDEKYQYGNEMFDYYDLNKGFGTGLFAFKKVKHVYKNIKI